MPRKRKDTRRKIPTQSRSKVTVEAIIEATKQCLEKENKFSTTSVAKRAGVSIGTLYQYFPSKESLVVKVIESVGQQENALVGQAVEGKKTLAEMLTEIIRAYFKVIAENQKLYIPLIEALYTLCDRHEIHRLEKAGVERMHALLALHGVKKKDLTKSAFIISYTFVGLLRFCAMVNPVYLGDRDFVDEVVKMVVPYATRKN